jgi:hypothetical protein
MAPERGQEMTVGQRRSVGRLERAFGQGYLKPCEVWLSSAAKGDGKRGPVQRSEVGVG